MDIEARRKVREGGRVGERCRVGVTEAHAGTTDEQVEMNYMEVMSLRA